MRKNVTIIADCICDLPDELIKKHDICIVYHYIFTENARFRDMDEITSANVFDYMATGRMPTTDNPPLDEYIELFRQNLDKADEVIYFVMASRMASAYACGMEAKNALGKDGERLHIVDTKHLSTAIGHIVLNAARMAEARKSAEEIVAASKLLVDKVRCSFIVKNVDYLHKNRLVSTSLQRICRAFNVHPVLTMVDGNMTVKRIFVGNYQKAQIKYIQSELKDNEGINKELLFVTQAGCTGKEISTVRKEIDKYCTFDKVMVTTASATVSCNCGPHTIGVLYMTE